MGNKNVNKKNYVLAMYDIRGKQNFIFRTNKLQEIVGASWLIRDCFDDYLFPAAEEVAKNEKENGKGIFSYKTKKVRDGVYHPYTAVERNGHGAEMEFSKESFESHLRDGYIAEVVYDGGGNFILLFENKELFRKVTYEFTATLMKKIGTLRVLGTCIEVDDLFLDYNADNAKLYAHHRINEEQESIVSPWACIPLVQVDRKTSQPLVAYEKDNGWGLDDSIINTIKNKGIHGKLTKESFAKLAKYHKEIQRVKNGADHDERLTEMERDFYSKNEYILDKLVEKKGEDSQLAVVYIDGNSMGAKVEAVKKAVRAQILLQRKIEDDPKTDVPLPYDQYVKKLRSFSDSIQQQYVENGIKSALESGQNNEDAFRIVVSAGDEVNFIVKAGEALDCAKSYLEALKIQNAENQSWNEAHKNDNGFEAKEERASSCAGIAVFHSHAPYADAYRIAEEACETGKKIMKKANIECASFIDFHICQGAIGLSLKRIREDETGGMTSRPWMMWIDEKDKIAAAQQTDENIQKTYSKITKWENIEKLVGELKKFHRTNVKVLGPVAHRSQMELDMELMRIQSHLKESDDNKVDWDWIFGSDDELDDSKRQAMIYDIALAYDLWFFEKGE